MKLIVVVGARPQFIKAAPLFRAIAKHNSRTPERRINADIVHTGQHYDRRMCQVFFDEGNLPEPLLDLGISGGSNSAMTGRMLEALSECFAAELPDAVLTFGDTNSTLAASLAAADVEIPTIHVEAGLRSGDLLMPEERNRIISDRLSSVLFCPSASSVENLENEGICGEVLQRRELPESDIVIRCGEPPIIADCGDIMLDGLLHDVGRLPEEHVNVEGFEPESFALCTLHRASNVDRADSLETLLAGLGRIAAKTPIVLPLHPRLKDRMQRFGFVLPQGVRGIAPLGRNDFLIALRECAGVLTDSGGLQKEAAFLGKPCVILRPTSEWVELVESGACILAAPDDGAPEVIERAWNSVIASAPGPVNVYGDGTAAEHIVATLDMLSFR